MARPFGAAIGLRERRAGRSRGGAVLLLAVLLLAGCASLRTPDELSVTVSKDAPPEAAASQDASGASQTPPGDAASTGSKASAGQDGSKQGPAGPAQPAAGSSNWQATVRDLSSILRSKNDAAGGQTLVPDPPDASSGAATRAASQPLDGLRLDPPGDLPQAEAVAAPAPETATAAAAGEAPITLNLENEDARLALQMLSRDASVNIMVSEGVSGKVTANLRGMTFDEALGAILRLCDLVAHREGNAIFVYPSKDLPQLDRALKVFTLNYVAAADVLESVKGLLSEAGNVYALEANDPTELRRDEPISDLRRTQEVVVVEDAPARVLRVEQYLREIDVPPRQVQIQAYVLEVVLRNDLEHGVNFEEIVKIAGNTATLKTLGFANTSAFPVPPPVPTPAPTGTGFYTKIDGKTFDAILEALKTTVDARTVADPKITVLNGQVAHIQIGEKLGYRDTTTQTETAATQSIKFLELGVVLDVTPRITEDHRIVMTVRPQISSGRINPDTELPEEETTEVTTNVMLDDGQGLVIGGLIKEKDADVQNKIPLFGDLPYLGMLFQRRLRETERTEVIVAILPRVLPYAGCPAAKEQLEVIRATTPLFHGPLRRCPRPWEPTLRDALPRRGDRL